MHDSLIWTRGRKIEIVICFYWFPFPNPRWVVCLGYSYRWWFFPHLIQLCCQYQPKHPRYCVLHHDESHFLRKQMQVWAQLLYQVLEGTQQGDIFWTTGLWRPALDVVEYCSSREGFCYKGKLICQGKRVSLMITIDCWLSLRNLSVQSPFDFFNFQPHYQLLHCMSSSFIMGCNPLSRSEPD